jgi:hypothetical protein
MSLFDSTTQSSTGIPLESLAFMAPRDQRLSEVTNQITIRFNRKEYLFRERVLKYADGKVEIEYSPDWLSLEADSYEEFCLDVDFETDNEHKAFKREETLKQLLVASSEHRGEDEAGVEPAPVSLEPERFFSKILRMKAIKKPEPFPHFSPQDLDNAAKAVADMDFQVVVPIIVKRTAPNAESYDLVDGLFQYAAVKRAYELHPEKKRSPQINAYVIENGQQELYRRQIALFRGAENQRAFLQTDPFVFSADDLSDKHDNYESVAGGCRLLGGLIEKFYNESDGENGKVIVFENVYLGKNALDRFSARFEYNDERPFEFSEKNLTIEKIARWLGTVDVSAPESQAVEKEVQNAETEPEPKEPKRASGPQPEEIKSAHAIVMVEDILLPECSYSGKEIDTVAAAIVEAGGLITPPVLKEEGPDRFSVIEGHFEVLAAAKAAELGSIETINAFVLQNHNGIETQAQRLKKSHPQMFEIIQTKAGKNFKSERSAKAARTRQGFTAEDYKVVEALEGGYFLQRLR